ncbi:MAG: iron-regulated protein frpC, partial [Pseudomonadota bacterium]
GEVLFGSIRDDKIEAKGGNDVVFGLLGDDKIDAGDGDDRVLAGIGDDTVSGGNGVDTIFGGLGDDTLVANKGDDFVFGGGGDDLIVWNNGDGSDLFDGGRGDDTVQVNFNTDLVNDDLQNKDVAEFSTTNKGVQFARIEVNDQTEVGLFQLDIRKTETLETNFGGGDDEAVIVGDVLHEIKLELDGGEGTDLLDFSLLDEGVEVNLKEGTAGTAHVENFENVIGTEFDDKITGDAKANVISGLGGVDTIYGRGGDDTLVGNKGDDFVFGGGGDDLIVWNNGDGSDLFNGGRGDDTVQVNFNTDLVNDDLQNKDVAEFSTTNKGVQFARIEVNDQTEVGLFQLDIRKTETLETNFGGGDDEAVIVGDVLDEIALNLDGGAGIDTLDFSQAEPGIVVDLDSGIADSAVVTNFENVIGTDGTDFIRGTDGDNVIRGGAGNDIMTGGAGADVFIFAEGDTGDKIVTDFEVGVDTVELQLGDELDFADLADQLVQDGDDVRLDLGETSITFENTQVADFSAEDFLIA